MANKVKEEIKLTEENLFVRLITSPKTITEEKDSFVNNEAILIGSPKIHIPDEAKKIWNKAAPKHFCIYPSDPSKKSFTLESSWTFSENTFNTLKEAKIDLKEYIDATKYLPFLFLSACGVSVHPQVESFLEHSYRGLHEWLMYFCLEGKPPNSVPHWEGKIEFVPGKSFMGRKVELSNNLIGWYADEDIELLLEEIPSESPLKKFVGRQPKLSDDPIVFSLNGNIEILPDALLMESYAKRFQPYYAMIIEFWKRKSKYVSWIKNLLIGEAIFCCLIEFTYQQLIDLGIFPGDKVKKTEISKNLTLTSKMFLKPSQCHFLIEDQVEVGLLQAINVSACLVGRENMYLTKRIRNGGSSAIYEAGRAFSQQGSQAKTPEFNSPYLHRGRVVVQKDKTRGLLQIVKDLTRNRMIRTPLPFQKIQK